MMVYNKESQNNKTNTITDNVNNNTHDDTDNIHNNIHDDTNNIYDNIHNNTYDNVNDNIQLNTTIYDIDLHNDVEGSGQRMRNDIKNDELNTPDYILLYNIAKPKLIIFDYIHTGNLSLVKKFKGDINYTDLYGINGLHFAASFGYYDICEYLLQFININDCDYNGQNALHYILRNDDKIWINKTYNLISLLINNKIDINKQDNNGWSPLHMVCNIGLLSVIKLLINNDIDYNINLQSNNGCTPLRIFIESIIIKASSTSEIEYNSYYNTYNDNIYKCGYNNDYKEILYYLIEHGADINTQDSNGYSCLHYAALYGNLNVVKLLTNNNNDKYHININLKTGWFGKTACNIAYDNKQYEISNYLNRINNKNYFYFF